MSRGSEDPLSAGSGRAVRPRLAPPVPVRRIHPLRRRSVGTLAPGVVRILMDSAEILSEGAVRESEGDPVFYGMTMITVDLEAAAEKLRIDPRADGPALAERLARNGELRLRALRIARLEAERRAGDRLPGTMRAELAARAQGTEVLVDVEIELPVDQKRGSTPREGLGS